MYFVLFQVLGIQQRKNNLCPHGVISWWKDVDDEQINKYIPCQASKCYGKNMKNKGLESDRVVSMNV